MNDQPEQSPTPRTDAILLQMQVQNGMPVSYIRPISNLARTIERELTASQRENAELRQKLEAMTAQSYLSIAEERDTLRAKLAEAERLLKLCETAILQAADCKLFYEESMDINNYATEDVANAAAALRARLSEGGK